MVKPRKRIDEGKSIRRKNNIGPEFQADIPELEEHRVPIMDQSILKWDGNVLRDLDDYDFEKFMEYSLRFCDHETAIELLAEHHYDFEAAKSAVKLKSVEELAEKRMFMRLRGRKINRECPEATNQEICALDIWKIQPTPFSGNTKDFRSRSQLNALYYERKNKDKRYNFIDLLKGLNARQARSSEDVKGKVDKKRIKCHSARKCSNCFNTIIGSTNDECCGKCEDLSCGSNDFKVFFDSQAFSDFISADNGKTYEMKNQIDRELIDIRRRNLSFLQEIDDAEIEDEKRKICRLQE